MREFDPDVKGGIVADEMGLGKTICSLATTLGNPTAAPTLIVCPKSLVNQWKSECRQFLHETPLVIESQDIHSLTNHQELFFHSIIITTYHALLVIPKGADSNPILDATFGRVILDEAHAIKNSKRKLARAAASLQAPIRWCLTGTPVTRVKRDFIALAQFVGAPLHDIQQLRDTYTMRRTFEDLSNNCARLRLPPLEMRLHLVPFETEDEQELYDQLKDEGRMRLNALESGVASEDNTWTHLIEVITRMRQAAVHPQLVYDGREEYAGGQWDGQTTKLNALVDLIKEHPPQAKSLIFTHWTYEMTAIVEALSSELGLRVVQLHGSMPQHQRETAIAAFRDDPSVDVMVLQIEVGGVGLNLQNATHIYINSLDWNASTELQAIARAHRIGCNHKVTVTRLAIMDTIDEYIYTKQQYKLGYAAEILGDDRLRQKLTSTNKMCVAEMKELFA